MPRASSRTRDKRGIVDWKWSQVDTDRFIEEGWGMRLRYYIHVALSYFYVYGLIVDIFFITTMSNFSKNSKYSFTALQDDDLASARGMYVYSIIMGVVLVVYRLRKARKVVNSDDISDTFNNNYAMVFQKAKSFSRFCFLRSLVKKNLKKKDKAALFIYTQANKALELVLIEIIQLTALVMFYQVYTEVSHEGKNELVIVVIKFILLLIVMMLAGAAMLLYPWFFCGYACSHCTCKGMGFHVSVIVDKRLTVMLSDQLPVPTQTNMSSVSAGSPRENARSCTEMDERSDVQVAIPNETRIPE